MNDIKISIKNEQKHRTETIRIYSQDMGMEFGIDIRQWKIKIIEGTELLN